MLSKQIKKSIISALLLLSIGGDQALVDHVKSMAHPVKDVYDLSPMMDMIQDQQLVLLGEASHGTAEYYSWRAEITKQLILEKGFSFIGVEGDWPAIYEVNKYVKSLPGAGESAEEVLTELGRWPGWMWGNQEIADLAEWLKNHNEQLAMEDRVGFYGIDMQDKRSAIDRVLDYLWEVDDEAFQFAVTNYGCLTRFEDGRSYLQAVARQMVNCEKELSEVLSLIDKHEKEWKRVDGRKYFDARMNAKVAVSGENQLRSSINQRAESWNVRVRHFKSTTDRLFDYYGDGSRGIIWAHNTHIGDARATDMRRAGMENMGQLAREKYGKDGVFALGFGTNSGEVLAGRQWGGAMQTMTIPEAMEGSYEYIFTQTGLESFLLLFHNDENNRPLMQQRGHRAIGVVYQPEADQTNNFVNTILPERYDAFIFFDRTEALKAL